MRTILVFLAFFTFLALGYGLIDRSIRDLPPTERPYANKPPPVKASNEPRDSLQSRYERVLNGSAPLSAAERHAIRTTPEMPRTDCKSVETVHHKSAKRAHERTIDWFGGVSGFGYARMIGTKNSRGIFTGTKEIDRVELVSLLKEEQPAVYVLDEIPTPPRMRVALRRSLDEFEERGLQAVRDGADLVWSPEAPKRMLGALRAENLCLECHAHAREGDLLGAFTYFLTVPVGEMKK